MSCYCTIEVFKKICVNAKHSQSTEDNYETNFLKIGLLWPVGGRTGRLILSWSGISQGIAAAGPGLPVTFELNVFISCWPFSSSVYISQLIKYPTVGCHPAPTPHP